jgi:hypothetical protein
MGISTTYQANISPLLLQPIVNGVIGDRVADALSSVFNLHEALQNMLQLSFKLKYMKKVGTSTSPLHSLLVQIL